MSTDELAGYLREAMARMEDLANRRRTGTPLERAAVDEEMDRLCQEVADGVGSPVPAHAMTDHMRRTVAATAEVLVRRRAEVRA